MNSGERDLPTRFAEHLEQLDVASAGDGLVVALSGGLDSVVLLHLLRFGHGLPPVDLSAAHLDHAMRPGSAADAHWVRGLTRAWNVPLWEERLEESVRSEDEARRFRYAFLERVRQEHGARWIVTAHHADDQAETVLFRVLRGTGLRGLRGIAPSSRGRSLLRPLLPFWREELEAYARSRGLRHRVDPTNLDRSFARNVLRHDLLPLAEEGVAPGARRALVRLAGHARRNEAVWEELIDEVEADVVEDVSAGRIVLARSPLSRLSEEVQARLLRRSARRLGFHLDEAGTRAAVEFTSSGASGRRRTLTGGVRLSREFDRLILTAPGDAARCASPEEAEELFITDTKTGGGRIAVGGRRWLVRWSLEEEPPGRWLGRFSPDRLTFPLRVRGWVPGDRIRLSYGSKKLKKLFGEERVPLGERRTRPLIEDATGRVLWVPGVSRAAHDPGSEEGDPDRGALRIAISDADG